MFTFFTIIISALTLSTAQEVAKPSDTTSVASDAATLKSFVAVVEAVGLVNTLEGKGPYDVFAATDRGFAKLPTKTFGRLLTT